MFKNHILIAVRHLVRYKEYTIINLVGLTIGMACALMIILWADHQVSMDKFHKNGKSIYMLRARLQFPDGQIAIDRSITSPLAPVLISEVPEIKDAVRITYLNKQIFNQGEKSFFENGLYADSTFFKVFSFDLLYGDRTTVLNQPNSVAISEKLAIKYFGSTTVLGKTLTIRCNKDELFTITGVLFCVLTLVLTMLGLFGQSVFSVQTRAKEIGIRKVNGASISGIVKMLLQEFIMLLIIAFLIAAPVALYLMNKWLQNFAYKIRFDSLILLEAGFLALTLVIITVIWQSYRQAAQNVTDVLRFE